MKQIKVKGGDAMQAFGAGLSKEWFPTVYLPLIVFLENLRMHHMIWLKHNSYLVCSM